MAKFFFDRRSENAVLAGLKRGFSAKFIEIVKSVGQFYFDSLFKTSACILLQ